ncbi:MAG: DUF4349 domain-containing protein [Clostridiales bacterium]|nr:DUF4349 domain-containing protein [Clostridiales bacterium]
MKKKWFLVVLLAAMALCLTGCPGGSSSGSVSTADEADFDVSEDMLNSTGIQMQMAGNSSDTASAEFSKKSDDEDVTENEASSVKLIRTVNMDLESDTNNVESTAAAIAAKAGDFGGYAESNRVHVYDTWTNAELTVRIPADRMDGYLEYIESTGMHTKSKSDSMEDVTLEYTDLSSRIRVLQTQKDKYMSYLEQAQTVSEVLEIEERLADVLADIESLQSSLNVLSNKVNYSTLNLTITWTSTPANGFSLSIGDEIVDAFEDLFQSVATMMHFIIVAVPNAIFYIVLFGALWRFFEFVFGIQSNRPNVWKRLKDKVRNRRRRKGQDMLTQDEESDTDDSDI